MQAFGADAQEAAVSRSFLFVPADSERKLKKSQKSGADALILDLEDSVAASEKPRARSLAIEFLSDRADTPVWVRINPLDTENALADLREIIPAAPFGIVLPKPTGARDSVQLGKLLDVLEQESGIAEGTTRIMPIATERPAALFHMHEYTGASSRLAALTWGAEDLSAALGASNNRDSSGNWLPPYELARSLCLFAAAAAEVAAIDTIFADFSDDDALSKYASGARRDGFSGMLAIHPAQVGIINRAFTPDADELERAMRIVSMFEANPDAGVIAFDGEMLDRPHLLQARKIITMAGNETAQRTDGNK
jgi:citrate lyase subunit beta/citryl-CoA lyase